MDKAQKKSYSHIDHNQRRSFIKKSWLRDISSFGIQGRLKNSLTFKRKNLEHWRPPILEFCKKRNNFECIFFTHPQVYKSSTFSTLSIVSLPSFNFPSFTSNVYPFTFSCFRSLVQPCALIIWAEYSQSASYILAYILKKLMKEDTLGLQWF